MTDLFDRAVGAYDAMVDWERRLAREGSFYRRLFARQGVSRVLDCACGPGHHAAMFAEWGLTVLGTDVSEAMIDRARAVHGEHDRLRWQVRSFTELGGLGESYDAVVCVGNSLSLAGDKEGIGAALASMADVLTAGGLLIVHVLNFWSVPSGAVVVQKVVPVEVGQGEAVLVRQFHRAGSAGWLDTLVLSRGEPGGGWACEQHSDRLTGVTAGWLADRLKRLGGGAIQRWGGYEGEPYRARESRDLIVIARKQR